MKKKEEYKRNRKESERKEEREEREACTVCLAGRSSGRMGRQDLGGYRLHVGERCVLR